MAVPEIIAQTKQIDIADLIGRYISLERVSSNEWQGPCPKCGGNDRLHCTAEWWFCRQCHTKRSDALDFMQHATGCTLQEAAEKLTNQPWPERKATVTHNQPQAQRPDERAEEWFEQAARLLKLHQMKLPGSEGAEYLRGRGLLPETWAAFGLGFAYAKNRDVDRDLPAVAMPWYRGGKLTAIRFRFLKPIGNQKITSLPGSKFSAVLFGGQCLPDWVTMPLDEGRNGAEQFCTLVICEGEINAMSIWQVAHHTNLHVMSMGSESGKLSVGAVAFAERYGRVLVWMDKQELAEQTIQQLPDALVFSSPNGNDANDLLQAGKLGSELIKRRWEAARSDDEKNRLFWDLWDGANNQGLDGSSAAAFKKLCEHRGRDFDLVEKQPGLWVTNRSLMVDES